MVYDSNSDDNATDHAWGGIVTRALRGSSRCPAIFRLLGINTEQPANVWDRQLKGAIVMWPGHIYGCISIMYIQYVIMYILIYIVSHDQLYPQWYGHRRMVMGMTIPQSAIVRHPTFHHQAGFLLQSIHPYPMKIPWKYVLQWTSMNRIQLTTDLDSHGTTHCIVPGNRFGTDPERDAQFDDAPLKLQDEITYLGPFIQYLSRIIPATSIPIHSLLSTSKNCWRCSEH